MLQYVRLRFLLVILALFCSTPLYAGAPVVVGIQSMDDAYAFATATPGTPISKTITLTFDANGAAAAYEAFLSSLAVQGVNAADFTILSGGTCGAGTTLSSSTPSCTVIVQYLPSSSAAENAQLAISCHTVALVGGFTLICAGGGGDSTGTISLFGSVLAAFVPTAPALSPALLTLLATLLVGAGTFYAARRNG